MKLRKYQASTVTHVISRLTTGQCALVIVSPTGSGKSVIGAAIVLALAGKRILWCAHRAELLTQARSEMIAAGVPESEIGILTDRRRDNAEARILIAGVLMFQRRSVPDVDAIFFDEAHRATAASYRRIRKENPKASVIGLTATPWRLDGSPLGDVFDEIHVAAGPSELSMDGFIASPVTYGLPLEKARALTKGVKGKREYSDEQLANAMTKKSLMGDTIAEWKRLSGGAPTIAFAVNHRHASKLHARFKAAGVRTEYMSKALIANHGAREKMLARLVSGKTQIVINVDVLSEGVDFPSVKCILLVRPTKSLTKFLQQVGRACRPFNEQRPIIIDHAGNCWRFGLPQEEREWALSGRAKETSGEAPVKVCPECQAMIPARCEICPECAAEQPISAREREEQEAELERLRLKEEKLAAARLRVEQVAQTRGFSNDWVEKVVRAMSEAA